MAYPVSEYLKRTRPYAAKYAEKYGIWNMMSEEWNPADVSGYSSSEDVYKACLKKGVTWQEMLNYKEGETPDILL